MNLHLWRPSLTGWVTRKHLIARAAILALLTVGILTTSAFLGQSARAATMPTKGLAADSPLSGGIPNFLGIPAIAPSNPHMVYQIASITQAGDQAFLRRSTDGGVTFLNFSLPVQSSAGLPDVFVSPLDAQRVFVTLGGLIQNDICGPGQGGSKINPLGGGGGGPQCFVQYVSQDGGAHWTRLSLPSNGVLGGFPSPTFHFLNDLHALQAQDNRLYAALTPTQGKVVTGPQLVTSTDGGLTWQEVDTGLPLTTQTLCDVAVTPTGSTILAVVDSVCPSAEEDWWRSDDAGAHWSVVLTRVAPQEVGLALVPQNTGASPLIYFSFTVCGAAPLASSPDSGGCGGAPTDLNVSDDGGKGFRDAPTKGYPNQNLDPGRPQGVRADGSVIFLVGNQFTAWKEGNVGWQNVGPAIADQIEYALVTGTDATHQTLWVVTTPDFGATFTIQSIAL